MKRFGHGVAVAALALLAGCSGEPAPALDGNVEEGRLLLRQFGCGSCHRIPGVATADSDAAPPLAGIGRRVYLAGVLPNTPENMVRWIRDPRHLAPGTAMPDLQVTERQARDMTAYLQGLE